VQGFELAYGVRRRCCTGFLDAQQGQALAAQLLHGAGLGGGWLSVALSTLGVFLSLLGIMLPSSVLTYTTTQWAHRHRDKQGIKAFKLGMAPVVIALLISTGWILTASHDNPIQDWGLWLLTGASMFLVWLTRIHLLWVLVAGAAIGGLGWV
jgi:chromate transporter